MGGRDLVDHKAHRSHTKLIGIRLYDMLKRHVNQTSKLKIKIIERIYKSDLGVVAQTFL